MTTATHLYALPVHRQLDLRARHPHLTEQQISDLLGRNLANRGTTCQRLDKRRGHLPTVALLGDDGRWHLRLGNVMVCSAPARPFLNVDAPGPAPAAGSVIGHAHQLQWWSDGHRYRVEALSHDGVHGTATPVWEVTLTGHKRQPELVRPSERCQISVHEGDWDPCRLAPRSSWRVHRRTAYIDAGGRMCHTCGASLGQDLEYDRHTHLIRGVLCQECATHVSECPHPANCYLADYLNNPPAGHLRKRYYVGGNRSDRKPNLPLRLAEARLPTLL
ncbi:hypothetical protein [Streptomyces sp. NPDC093589]|uniref:hypothetical protein n=1 Tax=Streptomyces sp. NPDC093589 TaxID=3366043 RepID=UPI00381B0E75